ncbi:hypothetical protein TWF281_009256 [Arthrobotrys megalospora]
MPIPSTPTAFVLAHLITLFQVIELVTAAPLAANTTMWIPPPMPKIPPPEITTLSDRGNDMSCVIL